MLVLAANLAAAQEQTVDPAFAIEEITITAQKREESLQDAPIAISAMSAEMLERQGIVDFSGIAQSAPSISFTPYPSSTNTLIVYMRGQGASDPATVTMDSAVGIYQDGFYISRGQLITMDLAELERVEVLRGPQGTLYGRNTTGGAVNLISKKPTGEFAFKEHITFGSRNRFRSQTVVDLPRWQNISSKVSLLYSRKDGYVENLGDGRDFGEEHQKAARLALRWDGSEAFTADYFFEIGELDSTPLYYQNPDLEGLIPGYTASGRPNRRSYREFDLPLSQGEFQMHGLTLAWDVGDSLTIRSLTSYRDVWSRALQDYAESFSDPRATPFMAVSFATDDNISSRTFTQELQFVGNLGARVEYVGGLYYFKEDARHYLNVFIDGTMYPPTFPEATTVFVQTNDRWVEAEAQSKAAYAQLTWTPPVLDDRLDVTLGARYTWDDRKADRDLVSRFNGAVVVSELGGHNDVDSSQFNPMVTVNFNWTDDLSTYARVATGYKAGGSSEAASPGRFGQTFEPEEVTSYELGLKSYFWNRRVRLNAALFRSDFDDMQMLFNTDAIDLSQLLGINAGKATIDGLELELLVRPIRDLDVSINYAYLDAEIEHVAAPPGTIFDRSVNPESRYDVGDNIAEVFVLPFAPKHSVNVGLDYTFLRRATGDMSLNLSYKWQDALYGTAPAGPAIPNRDTWKLKAHGTLDARLSWRFDLAGGARQGRISVWGRNITDERYPAQIIGNGAINDVPGQTMGMHSSAIAWVENPVYGVDLVYQF